MAGGVLAESGLENAADDAFVDVVFDGGDIVEDGIEGDGAEFGGFDSCEPTHEAADGGSTGGDDDGCAVGGIGWHIDILSENLVISCPAESGNGYVIGEGRVRAG